MFLFKGRILLRGIFTFRCCWDGRFFLDDIWTYIFFIWILIVYNYFDFHITCNVKWGIYGWWPIVIFTRFYCFPSRSHSISRRIINSDARKIYMSTVCSTRQRLCLKDFPISVNNSQCIIRQYALTFQIKFDFISFCSSPLFLNCNFCCARFCVNFCIGDCDCAGFTDTFSWRHWNFKARDRFLRNSIRMSGRKVTPSVCVSFRFLHRRIFVRHINAILIQFYTNRIRTLRDISAFPLFNYCHIDWINIVVGDGCFLFIIKCQFCCRNSIIRSIQNIAIDFRAFEIFCDCICSNRNIIDDRIRAGHDRNKHWILIWLPAGVIVKPVRPFYRYSIRFSGDIDIFRCHHFFDYQFCLRFVADFQCVIVCIDELIIIDILLFSRNGEYVLGVVQNVSFFRRSFLHKIHSWICIEFKTLEDCLAIIISCDNSRVAVFFVYRLPVSRSIVWSHLRDFKQLECNTINPLCHVTVSIFQNINSP